MAGDKMAKKGIKSNLGNIIQKWVDLLIQFSNSYSAKLSAYELPIETRYKEDGLQL